MPVLLHFCGPTRKRLFLSLFASFWAIQQTACTYGCGSSDCPEDLVDPSLLCDPVFDVERLTGTDYSDCEKNLVDDLKFLSKCNEYCSDENVLSKYEREYSYFEKEQWFCNDPSPYERCGNYVINGKMNDVGSAINVCPLDHIKADGVIVGYKCFNGESVSVEEGERRHKELYGQ